MTVFSARGAGIVGKLPSRGEYLPVPSHAPSFAAFDAWLSTAMEWAARAAGPGWPDAFLHGALHGFAFRSDGDRSENLLCGVLSPSRDSAGRLFPLALGVPLLVAPEVTGRPELMPFVLETLWADAGGLLLDLLASPPSGTIPPPDFAPEPDAEAEQAAETYDDWAARITLRELWALLGPALGRPAATLRLLLEAVAPVRGVESAQTTLSLRLPLGAGSGASLCFWLDVVRRHARWHSTLPSFFWSHDGTTGAALVHLGRPPASALAELWLPTGARDEIADLTRPVDIIAVEAYAPLSAEIVAALSDPQATLAQLLAAL